MLLKKTSWMHRLGTVQSQIRRRRKFYWNLNENEKYITQHHSIRKWTAPNDKRGNFVDHCCFLWFGFVMLSCLFIAAFWSPAGKALTSWLSYMWCLLCFVTFSCGVLGQVWCLIVSSPDICLLAYLNPYKPIVLLVGHRQTVQTQIRRRRTRRLIRVSTVCLQNVPFFFKNE